MTGESKEIQSRPKPGNIVLGTEMSKSLKGVDYSRNLFDSFKLGDYFKSINEFYLDGKGEIIKPSERIVSGVGDELKDCESGFNLYSAWGGLSTRLEWDKSGEEAGRSITISFFTIIMINLIFKCFLGEQWQRAMERSEE